MTEVWAIPMLITGGLFAGGVVAIAWERVPTWRESELAAFRPAFAHTLRRMDRLQPALALMSLTSTIGVAIGASGMTRTFAIVAGAGFLFILAGSGAWLVPVQKRLVASPAEVPSSELERLRRQWLRGHLIRTALALGALAFAAAAALA
jgi:Domain of unknown function (DUF1772)